MTTFHDPILDEVPDAPPPLPDAPPPLPDNAVSRTDATAVAAVQCIETDRNDPAFGFLTPEFWTLIEEAASVEDSSLPGFEWKVRKRFHASVLLTDLASALGMPPEYTRAYIRAIHSRLESVGVFLRERRLTVDGDLSTQCRNVTGDFIPPADRAAAHHAKGAAKRAVAAARQAIAAGDKSTAAMKALNDAELELEDAEQVVAEQAAMSTHLPVARHAFAVVIDPELYSE